MARPARILLWIALALILVVVAGGAAVWLSPALALEATMRLERGRAGLEQKVVEVDGHRIVYLEAHPDASPTILMVHGFSADKDNWTRFARYFGDYHVVVPDLPGFGESTRDEAAVYDIASQADRLAAFADALGLEPHHVVGNSMGGNLVGAYAVEHRERVESVAFFANSGVTPTNESEVMQARRRGETPLLAASVRDYARIVDLVFVERPFLPEPVLEHFARRAVETRAFNAKISSDLAERPFPLEPVLEDIDVPVLILWGDSDRVLDVSSIEVMQPRVPHAVVVIMDGCGHLPMVERPQEAALHYLRFLQVGQGHRRGAAPID